MRALLHLLNPIRQVGHILVPLLPKRNLHIAAVLNQCTNVPEPQKGNPKFGKKLRLKILEKAFLKMADGQFPELQSLQASVKEQVRES